jgi:NADP-dependent 3-hydroxy acid dehydrogenase YdfG
MTEGVQDKVVVITGASSGLGEAAARRLAQHGAKLVLGARRLDRLQALAKELGLGADAVVRTDVSRHEEVKRLVDRAVKSHGRVDVMINNAGLMPQSLLERLKIDEWDRMIDVNIQGVLYGVAAALPIMKAQKSGHFINVSSVAGHKVRAGGTVYSATKSAVRVISEGLRQEVKPYNIRTTIISPGGGGERTTRLHYRPRHRPGDVQVLPGDGHPRGFVREHGDVRHEPAGGRRRQ